jgi:hypothetical protein
MVLDKHERNRTAVIPKEYSEYLRFAGIANPE